MCGLDTLLVNEQRFEGFATCVVGTHLYVYTHRWQLHVEIEDYSVVYFDPIAVLKVPCC